MSDQTQVYGTPDRKRLSLETEAFCRAARALAEAEAREAQKALVALKGSAQSSQSALIKWKLRYYDGDERDWRGYVSGIEKYRVMRGGWFTHFDQSGFYGDSCTSEKQGKAKCLEHLLSTLASL
jgi:hypothetical protein